jgi:predicted dehydrogenase
MAERVQWGILGTADIAAKHFIPGVRGLDNSEVLAVASRNEARAREYADQCGIPRAHGSYEALLADPDVDAVYLPLPTGLHAEWCLRCAEAGKPTLCEKPLATNAADARRIVDAFTQRNVPLAEALMYPFHPITQHVKRLVDEGAVGKIRVIQTVFCAKCERPDNYRLQPDIGGGALLDVGSYCVSVMRLLTGEEPTDVAAFAHFRDDTDVDEWMGGTLRFPSGVVASFGCGLLTEFGCSYEVFGTDGRIFVPQGVVPNPDADGVIHYHKNYECEETVLPPANQWQLVARDFADALLENRLPSRDLEDAVRNLEALDRLRESARRANG